MPSGWDVYYIVFLSALLALGIPAVLAAISYLVSPRVRGRKQRALEGFNTILVDATQVNRVELGQKLNARCFLAVNASLVLITLMLSLIPCVGALQPGAGRGALLRGLAAIVSITAFAGLGLFYSARKRDLGWLKGYYRGEDRPAKAVEP